MCIQDSEASGLKRKCVQYCEVHVTVDSIQTEVLAVVQSTVAYYSTVVNEHNTDDSKQNDVS